MVQHILVAHDLSSEADIALQRGAQLAQQRKARLSLMHVLGEHDEEKAVRDLLQTRLESVGFPDITPWIRRGRPVEEILTQATGLEADLLVLGQHHQHSPEGFAGTTLERILLGSPIPLLLAVSSSPAYTRALAAMDYSRCASRALRVAWKLLPPSAELTALNIHETAEIHQPDEDELVLQRELFEQLIADLSCELEDSCARLVSSLRHGERSNCLDAAIRELQPQLLVLGSHSRGEMSSALLGSLAREYLEQPPCDILIAR